MTSHSNRFPHIVRPAAKRRWALPFAFLATALAFAAEVPADLYPSADQRQPSPGHTTYHIDPAAGDDANTGLARDQAWKSFRRINALRLAAGDKVEIGAPGSFDQTLALSGAGTADEPVEIRFAPGRHDFHPDNAYREAYQISNTNGDPDGRKAVGILLAGAKHLRLTGPGASIVFRGKMIEVCVDGCENIEVSGLSFDYQRPTVSEFQITKTGDDFADLAIHKDSTYMIKDGKITWLGEGWSYTTGLAQELDPVTGDLRRRRDPLVGLALDEIGPHLVRARGRTDMKPGRIYQIRDTLRDCAGVFTRRSRDITWKDVTFRFLHGMGLVNQFSENLTFDSVVIAPDEAGGRTTAAWADGIQVSGCKGRLLVKDCVFSGAHDDAINIHGTYLRVVELLPNNQVRVRFMHPQTFGFMAYNAGDEIEFVHSDSLATYGPNRVTAARMLDPMELLLTLENPVPDEFRENDVIENVTWTPEVEIRGCKVSHIPTRGFLISTRRKVLVEDNEFLATHMSAILVAQEARSWFESGCVRDMTIRGNRFIRCGEPVVSIDPSNTLPNTSVHRNIRIENNGFELAGKTSVKAKSTSGLRVTGNKIVAKAGLDDARSVQTSDCADVVVEQNDYLTSTTSVGEAEFKGCYAKWSDSELTVGNGLMERKWTIKQGLLTPLSFRDKTSGREWLRGPGRQPAPHPGGDLASEDRATTFATRTGKLSPVEDESLVIDMTSKGTDSSFHCRIQVFPDASGVTLTFDPGTTPGLTESAENEAAATPDGLEDGGARRKKAKTPDAIEDLMLAPRHFRFTQVTLMDQTDHNNELVHEQEWLPLRDSFDLSGNLFSIEDPVSGDGLVFVKLAPLPHARPVKNPWDARVLGENRRVLFAGHGYRSALLAYSGGRPGRIAALQDYQRSLRTFDPDRDARFLSNTWGDRSKDARVTEAFLRQEIDAGARLGVDVVQVDDGWQKGQSGNSAFGKGAWGRFYEADPDFWSPHPERFPNGLKPLVEAAAEKGMKFGLWFGPDSENDMTHWERDADLLIGCCRKEGVGYIKIDAVHMPTRKAEENLGRFYQKILRETGGRVVFDSDLTAGLRPGYFGAPDTGPVFVENRYTDWQTYWPHLTLRNLWQLAGHVDPLRLRMEFLNNQRNAKAYGDDPLAPARYSPDALFATVMFSNPLGWFETSNLPKEYFDKIPPLVASWKKEREAIFSGHVIPIGSAPDGSAWTGFASVAKDRESARVVVFRELNEAADWSVQIPLLNKGRHAVTVLGGTGNATVKDGVLTANIPEKLQYLFLRID